DAREYGIAGMFRGDVPDQLHQRYGLADAGAAEQADLAALGDGHDQVDDLDAGFQQLRCGRLVFIGRCLPVDRHGCLGADVALVVDGIPEYVHDAPERLLPDRYRDVLARIADAHATLQAFAGTHGDGAYDPVAELLLYLERDAGFIDHQRVVNLGDRVAWKLHVNHGADDLYGSTVHAFYLWFGGHNARRRSLVRILNRTRQPRRRQFLKFPV